MNRHGVLNLGLPSIVILSTGCLGDDETPTAASDVDGDTSAMDDGTAEAIRAGCVAECRQSAACGYVQDEPACLGSCTEALESIDPDCAAAWGEFIECQADAACEEFPKCPEAGTAVDALCVPSDEAAQICTAYCAREQECEADVGPLQECEKSCGIDRALQTPACASAELAVLDCYARTECSGWERDGADSPCAAEEEAWPSACA